MPLTMGMGMGASKTQQMAGSGETPTPSITVTSGTLTFSDTTVYPVTVANYSVTSENLASDITVTAPTGYQVSLSEGSGFGSSVTVTKNTTDTVYVKLTATTVATHAGNITHVSDTTSANKAVSAVIAYILEARQANYRIIADGGSVVSMTNLSADIATIKGIADGAATVWDSVGYFGYNSGGLKLRTTYVTKLYDVHNITDGNSDFFQTIETRQPALTSGSIVFDATDDSMIGGSALLDVSKNVPGLTIFIVKKLTAVSNATQHYLRLCTDAALSRVQCGKNYSAGNQYENITTRRLDADSAVSGNSTAGLPSTDKKVMSYLVDYTNDLVKSFRNGSATDMYSGVDLWGDTHANSSNTSSVAASIGVTYNGDGTYNESASLFPNCTIDCVLIVKKALSDAQRQAIENMLLSRYGLAK